MKKKKKLKKLMLTENHAMKTLHTILFRYMPLQEC